MKHDLRLLGTSFVTIDYLNSPEVIDLQCILVRHFQSVYVRTCMHAYIVLRTFLFLGDFWPSVVEVLSKSDIFTQVAIFVSKLHARCRSRIAKICVLVSPNFRSKTLFRLSCITIYYMYFFSRLWLCSDCSAVVSPYLAAETCGAVPAVGVYEAEGLAGQRSVCMLC